ncbi:MAG: hypothetical protein AABZ60_08395, partial [Planctomycetota bacterium]
MDKAIRQTQQELNQFLKQHHFSLDELFTYFPNQLFPEPAPAPMNWDSFYREDLELDYLPDPTNSQENPLSSSRFSAPFLSRLLQKVPPSFVFYVLIVEVPPLARGLYRYREKEHALEFLSEPGSKLIGKVPDLKLRVPLLFLVSLPRWKAEPFGGQRFLIPALIQLGQWIEHSLKEVPVKIRYLFDGSEIIK